jgi:hypothetical protein
MSFEELIIQFVATFQDDESSILEAIVYDIEDALRALEITDPAILVLVWPWRGIGLSGWGEGKCEVDAVEGGEEVGCVPDFLECR